MPPRLLDLERRIADLEQSNRRLQRVSTALVALLLAMTSLGASSDAGRSPTVDAHGRVAHDTLIAKALHLVDDSGALRILISARAGVSLLDDSRRPRAVLSVDATGPGLLLYGETSKAGGAFTVNRDGPALSLRDNQGNTRALLTAIDQGPALILSDHGERERLALAQRNDGVSINLLDAAGRTTWSAPSQR